MRWPLLLAVVINTALLSALVLAPRGFQQALGREQPLPHKPAVQEDKWFICDDEGQALPVLFAGFEKAGSLTLYNDLKDGVRGPAGCEFKKQDDGPLPCKELHYFDRVFKPRQPPYNRLFGSCDSIGAGKVVSDFTPVYFCGRDVAIAMKLVYGPKFQEPIFQLSLREPMRRALAEYSHFRAIHPDDPRYIESSFQEHIERWLASWRVYKNVDTLVHLLPLPGSLVKGLYYYNFRRYFDIGFLPSQFIVYPASQYLSHRDDMIKNPVLQAVRRKLGPNIFRGKNITASSAEGSHRNPGSHKTLEEELPESLRTQIQEEVLNPANQKLMDLLAVEVGNGMTLVGYDGKAGDTAAVAKWMTSGWEF